MINYHRLGGLQQQKLISHNSRGQKSEIKVSARLIPSGSFKGELFDVSFLASGSCQQPSAFLDL